MGDGPLPCWVEEVCEALCFNFNFFCGSNFEALCTPEEFFEAYTGLGSDIDPISTEPKRGGGMG